MCNVPAGNDFVAIAGGDNFATALKSDGSLGAWGYNVNHQCDVPLGNYFIAIAAGKSYGLALTPEPSTLLLLGLGAVMLRKRR